jgi:hypothetical protein
MAEELPDDPAGADLPPGTRHIQRVEALPPEYGIPLYPVACHQCQVVARVGVASSSLRFTHVERSLLVLESDLTFANRCPTCRVTTEAACSVLTALSHDHWEHAPAVGVLAFDIRKIYDAGPPGTCLYHATLVLRCGVCAWGEVRRLTERTLLRIQARVPGAGDPAAEARTAPDRARSGSQRGRRSAGPPANRPLSAAL